MKNILLTSFFLMALLYPSASFPSFIIHLKDGGRFLVEQYWEEEGEIKFNRYGGVVGLSMTLVERIEASDLPVIEARGEKQAPEPELPSTAEKVLGDQSPGEAPQKLDVELIKKQKQELLDQNRKAKAALDQALLDRDRSSTLKIQKEMEELYDRLSELMKEVKARSSGTLPGWWHEGGRN